MRNVNTNFAALSGVIIESFILTMRNVNESLYQFIKDTFLFYINYEECKCSSCSSSSINWGFILTMRNVNFFL